MKNCAWRTMVVLLVLVGLTSGVWAQRSDEPRLRDEQERMRKMQEEMRRRREEEERRRKEMSGQPTRPDSTREERPTPTRPPTPPKRDPLEQARIDREMLLSKQRDLQSNRRSMLRDLSELKIPDYLDDLDAASEEDAAGFTAARRAKAETLAKQLKTAAGAAAGEVLQLRWTPGAALRTADDRRAAAREINVAEALAQTFSSPLFREAKIERLDLRPPRASTPDGKAPRLEPFFDLQPFTLEFTGPYDDVRELVEALQQRPVPIRFRLQGVSFAGIGDEVGVFQRANLGEALPFEDNVRDLERKINSGRVRVRVTGWALDYHPAAGVDTAGPAEARTRRRDEATGMTLAQLQAEALKLKIANDELEHGTDLLRTLAEPERMWLGALERLDECFGPTERGPWLATGVVERVEGDAVARGFGDRESMMRNIDRYTSIRDTGLPPVDKTLAAQLPAARTPSPAAGDVVCVFIKGVTTHPYKTVYVTERLKTMSTTWRCRKCGRKAWTGSLSGKCPQCGNEGGLAGFEPDRTPTMIEPIFLTTLTELRTEDRYRHIAGVDKLPKEYAETWRAIGKREMDLRNRVIRSWKDGDVRGKPPLPTRQQFQETLEGKGVKLEEVCTFTVVAFADDTGRLAVAIAGAHR